MIHNLLVFVLGVATGVGALGVGLLIYTNPKGQHR